MAIKKEKFHIAAYFVLKEHRQSFNLELLNTIWSEEYCKFYFGIQILKMITDGFKWNKKLIFSKIRLKFLVINLSGLSFIKPNNKNFYSTNI